MKRSLTFAKAVCPIVSITFLVGANHLTLSVAVAEIEGAGESVQARIGSSFEDMTAGTLVSQNEPAPLAPAARVPSATRSSTLPSPLTAVPLQAVPPATLLLPSTPPVTPEDIITLKTPDSAAPSQTRRPQLRDPVSAAKAAPPPKVSKPKRTVRTSTRSGNANRKNTQGAETGSQTAKA